MNKLYHKIPFVLELIINGCFILMYSLYKGNKIANDFIPFEQVEIILTGFKFLAPVVVIISIISYYIQSANIDDFFRKYIFSFICIVPMLITLGDMQFTFWLSAVHLFSSILSLYEGVSEDQVKSKQKNIQQSILEKIKLAPAQIVILSFLAIILVGTLLLILPISASEGKNIGIIDAFFMATSATCVTGLTTLSLTDNFSLVGQVIVLILIQIGGLGYMTLYSSMTILLGKSLAVRDQVLMQDLLDISSIEDLVYMIKSIIKYTLMIELVGAICLTIAFTMSGKEFGESLFYGIFHSISAFCNAGFAMFNNSFEDFAVNPYIHFTISALIVLGGLGFIVLKELEYIFRTGRKLVNLSVHSKVVLTVNLTLIILVAIYFFFSEYLHALSGYSFWEQIQISVFQSITTRTAGFNTIGLNNLYTHSIYFLCLVMFIGASPGSTGGGIKTTTFAILFQSVKATLRGKDRVEFFDRTVPNIIVVRSIAIIIISLMMVSFFILLMMRIEPEHDFLSLFFEVVSAFATVGLSLGITPYLSAAGKLIVIVIMFIGRVGPLTLFLALTQKKNSGNIEYPEGKIMIG